MKTYIFYTLLTLGIVNALGQNDPEVHTKTIKIDDFITYVASQEPSETDQKLYLAVETGVNGFDAQQRFHLEQGIKLLSKRLPENSSIALGTYGANGRLIAPYTKTSQLTDVYNRIPQSVNEKTKAQLDGIDLAFQMASTQFQEDANNMVIIIRNNQTAITKIGSTTPSTKAQNLQETKEKPAAATNQKLGGAIALTALSILPEVLDIIKD